MPQTVLQTKPAYLFDSNGTYVVAGGLGGIGRSIARWLVSCGAKNLLLLSRSGPAGNEKAQALLAEMKEKAVHVESPVCDITCLTSLQKVVKECEGTMPPIKGVFQASMVLRVGNTN